MTMKPTTVTGLSIFALALAGGLAFAAGQYGPGASDSEIKIGNTMPYSGPASAYGTIGKAEAAYFTMVNEQGGGMSPTPPSFPSLRMSRTSINRHRR